MRNRLRLGCGGRFEPLLFACAMITRLGFAARLIALRVAEIVFTPGVFAPIIIAAVIVTAGVVTAIVIPADVIASAVVATIVVAGLVSAAIAVRLNVAGFVAVLTGLVELLAFGHFALRLTQHPGIMLGMLQKRLLGDAVVRQLRIPRKSQIFFNDLLGRPANLAFGARAVEDAVDDIAQRALAVRLVARTGFR